MWVQIDYDLEYKSWCKVGASLLFEVYLEEGGRRVLIIGIVVKPVYDYSNVLYLYTGPGPYVFGSVINNLTISTSLL